MAVKLLGYLDGSTDAHSGFPCDPFEKLCEAGMVGLVHPVKVARHACANFIFEAGSSQASAMVVQARQEAPVL